MPNVSAKFLELVGVVAKTDFKFNNLKPIVLAQWMLESNRGHSALFLKYNNAAGIKWRQEMIPYGRPVEYGAHDGTDLYCCFNNLKSFVLGYWAFIARAPYRGWENHASSGDDYITFIKMCGYAQDSEYVGKVMGLVREANALLSQVMAELSIQVHFAESHNDLAMSLTAHYPNQFVFDGSLNDRNVRVSGETAMTIIRNLVSLNEKGISLVDTPIVPDKKPFRLFFDPGHSDEEPGAISNDGSVREEAMNRIVSDTARAILGRAGIVADKYDPQVDDLRDIGRHAKGYDGAISIHHNSYDGNSDPGVEILVDNDKAKPISIDFAEALGPKLATALNARWRGVKRFAGAVLDEMEQNCNGYCVLVECYFLNPYNKEEATERSRIAGEVIATHVVEWLATHPED